MGAEPTIRTSPLAAALARVRGLGPACERALSRPRVVRALELRVRRGDEPDDAAIAVMALCARHDDAVGGEVLHDVMEDMTRFGSRLLPPLMRPLHDADDLVVSVLGDCFREIFELRVDTRAQLLALLRQRMLWKTRDRSRGLLSLKRREDLRVESGDRPESWTSGYSPMAQAAAREELQRLVRRLQSLTGRDRRILEMHLTQRPLTEIAKAAGLTPDATRRAVRRLLAAEDPAR